MSSFVVFAIGCVLAAMSLRFAGIAKLTEEQAKVLASVKLPCC